MNKSRIILIGGFLGSGKTTLMHRVAAMLSENGTKVGLITNDQATALVDTGYLERSAGTFTEEVSGSCFCCNFPGLEGAIDSLLGKIGEGIILAEPVGSCTDLSATIMQTLKDRCADRLVISPLSVLADPEKLTDILAGGNAGLHRSSAYIVSKQFEEADYILINKIDTLSEEQAQTLKEKTAAQYPLAKVLLISGKNGTGVQDWLDDLLQQDAAGTHLIDVDYDTYAEGEAVLGWLNTTVRLTNASCDWKAFAEELLKAACTACTAADAPVGHIKLMIEGETCFLVGNLTGGMETLSVRGASSNEPAVTLTFNARAQMSPESLEEMVRGLIGKACEGKAEASYLVMESLMPGRPAPTYHYEEVIQ